MSTDSDADADVEPAGNERGTPGDASADGTGDDGATGADDGEGIEALGRRLGERIAETPEYRAYEEREAAVQADEEAQELIAAFERERSEYALARQTGRADEEALQSLKEAQRELHGLPVMEEYLEAQARLVDRLEDVNEAISEPLSVDFGGEAGGCCHD